MKNINRLFSEKHIVIVILLLFLAFRIPAQNTSSKNSNSSKITEPATHHEVPDDLYVPMLKSQKRTSPAYRDRGAIYFTNQVNVDNDGNNILNDAANEPSIAIDPNNANKIAIGWRQFDNISSNFRQAGYAYTLNGGNTWTFPGVIEPGIFRSDPVLGADADGNFYYNSLTVEGSNNYVCDVYIMDQGGTTWDGGTDARGGDKQWMIIDQTGGLGSGNIYAAWNQSFTSCYPGFFTRSTDGGAYYEGCVEISGTPQWGTLAVGPEGELYVSGTSYSGIMIAKSTTAQDPDADVTWDFDQPVDLGGDLVISTGPNPGGLLGQAWVAVDKSGGEFDGNVYMLASVNPGGSDPLDVMFAKSTDGGTTWGDPVKINDDQNTSYWQWFGTMSVAPNGRIDVVWLDTRDHPAGQQYYSSLYYSYSIDGGETFSENERLSDSFDPHVGWPQQSKMGDYYHMISDNSGAHLAWANTLNGEQDVYYTHIDPNVQITDFIADNTTPFTIETVSFTDLSTGTPESWTWQFTPATVTYMNGTDASSQNPKVRFDEPGYYTVQLTTGWDDGGSDNETKIDYIYATVMLTPLADFEAHITDPTTIEFVNFTDLSINDPNTWLWSFTPGTITYMGGYDETSQNPRVRFDESGYYTVELTAGNAAGSDTETKIDYIFCSLPDPVADFEADNTMPVVDEDVHFTDLTEYEPSAWAWSFTPNTVNFTEGTNENTQNPVVQFTDPGLYTVELTVTNESGSDTEIKTDYIYAVDILTVVAEATPQEVCLGSSVQLDAEVGGGSGNYTFNWSSSPEGFSSTEQNPVVSPEESTEYIVEVSDGTNSVEDNIFVTVYLLPEIVLGNWPEYLCNQQEPPVQLTATPQGGVFSGDAVTTEGLFSPEEAPLGWNIITYTYIDEHGCESLAADSVFVDECVGINKFDNDVQINIYPNPTRQYLNVVIDGSGNSVVRLKLINLLGQTIYEHEEKQQQDAIKLILDLSDEENGLYILSIRAGAKNYVEKVFLSK